MFSTGFDVLTTNIFPLDPVANIVRRKSIEKWHYKRHNEETNRIPFTLTYHPQNLAVKNVILKNFKILRNDPETKHLFPLPPLISFKRDKNIGNFLVKSDFKVAQTSFNTFKRPCY